MPSRLIQAIALVLMLTCAAAGGVMLQPILRQTEEAGLRYTNVSVEGAPPFVALGTAIGALRGLIVDYLWIKVNIMKEKGLFYEVMADADLITKLQPRFAAVWAFHGHNMAYNISVATQTQEERWDWVNAGIRLVRGEGIRHNPNDLVLHKELAFWFAHKVEGVSDDAHLFYKREFCREWHFALGPPPDDWQDRIDWIKAIADAPRSLEEAERRTPGVRDLITRLDASLTPFGESEKFKADRRFLETYGTWLAVKEQSEAARLRGVEQRLRSENPYFAALDQIASDESVRDAWNTLVLYVRRRVLVDEYNMDPQLMYQFTKDLGPIDWRHGQAHALYWSRRGEMMGEARVANEDDIYKILNNDRVQLQALQGLARWGRITFDPFSSDIPSRFPEPRFIQTINDMFSEYYAKHYDTRGGGGESFIAFLKNFMGSAIRQAYRSGERERAQELMDSLDAKFGGTGPTATQEYKVDLEVFVQKELKGEIEFQPHIAPSEAYAALRYGFRLGVGLDDKDTYDEAIEYVNGIIDFFKGNEYNDYVTRFGTGRMAAIMADLEITRQRTFLQLMTDPTISVTEKATIWANIDRFEPTLRVEVYDLMMRSLPQQFARHELSEDRAFDEVFPEPPGLDEFRAHIEQLRLQEEQRLAEQQQRDDIARREEVGRKRQSTDFDTP
jgi:hypothetical protein